MTDLTNPPFMRKPGAPPIYLRELSAEELAQWRRLRDWQEWHMTKTQEDKDVQRTIEHAASVG